MWYLLYLLWFWQRINLRHGDLFFFLFLFQILDFLGGKVGILKNVASENVPCELKFLPWHSQFLSYSIPPAFPCHTCAKAPCEAAWVGTKMGLNSQNAIANEQNFNSPEFLRKLGGLLLLLCLTCGSQATLVGQSGSPSPLDANLFPRSHDISPCQALVVIGNRLALTLSHGHLNRKPSVFRLGTGEGRAQLTESMMAIFRNRSSSSRNARRSFSSL